MMPAQPANNNQCLKRAHFAQVWSSLRPMAQVRLWRFPFPKCPLYASLLTRTHLPILYAQLKLCATAGF